MKKEKKLNKKSEANVSKLSLESQKKLVNILSTKRIPTDAMKELRSRRRIKVKT